MSATPKLPSYQVTRYPHYYAVTDLAYDRSDKRLAWLREHDLPVPDEHNVVANFRSRDAAHRRVAKLTKQVAQYRGKAGW